MRRILIIIHGVTVKEYQQMRADMQAQFLAANIQPFFVRIPLSRVDNYRGVQWDWLNDEEDTPPIPEAYLELEEQ